MRRSTFSGFDADDLAPPICDTRRSKIIEENQKCPVLDKGVCALSIEIDDVGSLPIAAEQINQRPAEADDPRGVAAIRVLTTGSADPERRLSRPVSDRRVSSVDGTL